jgi:outer membrane protein assembly factor BamA
MRRMTREFWGRIACFSLIVYVGGAHAGPPSAMPQVREVSLASSVRLSGNANLTEAALRQAMLKAVTLEEAQSAVEDAYRAAGYLAVWVTPTPAMGTAPARLAIDEGRHFSISAVQVVEDDPPKKDALTNPETWKGLLTVRSGELFNAPAMKACLAVVRDRYDAAGYGAALVTPVTDVNLDAATVAVRIDVERGRSYKVTRIDVKGASDEGLVRRLVVIKAGEVFSNRAQAAAQKRLRDDAHFANAEIEAAVEGNGMLLTVTVEEKKAK